MAAGSTYTPIATYTAPSAQSSVSFSSFSGYTDIHVVVNARSSWTGDEYDSLVIRFNSDSGTNYSSTALTSQGTAAETSRGTNMTALYGRVSPSTSGNTSFSVTEIDLMNYANTNIQKNVLLKNSSSNEYFKVIRSAGLWRNTGAITSLSLAPGQSGSQFVTGSTFTIYGISAA